MMVLLALGVGHGTDVVVDNDVVSSASDLSLTGTIKKSLSKRFACHITQIPLVNDSDADVHSVSPVTVLSGVLGGLDGLHLIMPLRDLAVANLCTHAQKKISNDHTRTHTHTCSQYLALTCWFGAQREQFLVEK
jgi:hypothetical protein